MSISLRRIAQAIVLAGGAGARLMPLTASKPKPLVPIANRPILDYAIDLLLNSGVEEAILVVKYLGDRIKEHIKKNPKEGIDIKMPDVRPLDTADAVRKVSTYIQDDFVITMADILTNINLREFMQFHIEKEGIASITLEPVDTPLEYGVIILDSSNRIKHFLEKPQPAELYVSSIGFSEREVAYLHSNLINTGMYAFSQEILDILDQQPSLMDFGKHVFPFLIEKTFEIYGYVAEYYWLDIGNPKIYLKANWDVLRGECQPYSGNVFSSYSQLETGDVWVGEGVNISPSAHISPPVLFGDNVEIEDSAKIGPFTVIGDDCVIERNTVIENSVLWERVIVEEEAKVTEAIICNDSVIGERAKLDSFSIIGDHSKIGKEIHIETNMKILPSTMMEG